MSLHLRDVYDFRDKPSTPEFLVRLGQALLLARAALTTGHYLFSNLVQVAPISSGARVLTLISVFLTTWHILLRMYFGIRSDRTKLLIVGTGDLAQTLAREILRRPELGIAICGFVDDKPHLVGVSLVNPKVIGLNADLKRIVAEMKINKLVVELQDRRGRLPIDDLLALKTRGTEIEEATSLYERLTGKIAIENLKPSWMIFNEGFEVSRWLIFQKQAVSVAVSCLLMLVFLPLLPVIALLIRLDSRGPIFHGQERVGQEGKIFRLWKFRSMYEGAERDTGPVWASADDARVTRVGKYLRRMRLDELPQLYNVLKGEMTLVGPRPERPHFVKQLSSMIPFYDIRHSVKPGVTGWAQINYQYGNSVQDAIEKLQYDLFYIKNMSGLIDLVILFNTAKTVLVRKGS